MTLQQGDQVSPMEVHNGVIGRAILVRRRCGHTVIYKQLQWRVASSLDFCLEVGYLPQVEGGG